MKIGAAATTASDSDANAARREAPAVAIPGSTGTDAAAAGCNTLPPLTMIIILAATLVGSAVSRTATEALTESARTVTDSSDVVYVFWIVAMFVPSFLWMACGGRFLGNLWAIVPTGPVGQVDRLAGKPMAAVSMEQQLANRQVEMTPASPRIRIVGTRVEKRRRKSRARLIAIECPRERSCREECVSMLTTRTMESPAPDGAPIIDYRLELHGFATNNVDTPPIGTDKYTGTSLMLPL